MGIDALDLAFRLEKSFNVRIPRREMSRLYRDPDHPERRTDPTIGKIHQRFCQIIADNGFEVPGDSWERVQGCVSECLHVPMERVHRDSRFMGDLGAS